MFHNGASTAEIAAAYDEQGWCRCKTTCWISTHADQMFGHSAAILMWWNSLGVAKMRLWSFIILAVRLTWLSIWTTHRYLNCRRALWTKMRNNWFWKCSHSSSQLSGASENQRSCSVWCRGIKCESCKSVNQGFSNIREIVPELWHKP